MPVNRVESMLGVIGPRKEVNITYKTLDETLLDTAEAIPNAEPATAQISYTVSADTHLPTMDANVGFQSVGMLCVAGLNLTASARTLSYRLLKNSASLTTGTVSCVASQYWTLKVVNSSLIGLVAGDVIEVKLWCADATWLNWSYKYFACAPTRIKLFNDARKIAVNVKFTDGGITYPIPTLGTPSTSSYNAGAIYGYVFTSVGSQGFNGTDMCIGVLREHTTNGIYIWGVGDNSSSVTVTCHATAIPRYTQNYYKITKIAWNELFLQI
jgi:hypothetical protein